MATLTDKRFPKDPAPQHAKDWRAVLRELREQRVPKHKAQAAAQRHACTHIAPRQTGRSPR
jgi:hypothetical protein